MARSTETRPEHTYDWITADDVARFAIMATAHARRAARPPAGERFVHDGVAWSTRATFAEEVAETFTRLVKAHAWQQGVSDDFEVDAMHVARWKLAEVMRP